MLKLQVRHVDEAPVEGPRLRSIPTNGFMLTDRTASARPVPALDLNSIAAQMACAKESEAESGRQERQQKEDSMLLEETISLVSQLEKRKAEAHRQNEEGEDVLKKVKPALEKYPFRSKRGWKNLWGQSPRNSNTAFR